MTEVVTTAADLGAPSVRRALVPTMGALHDGHRALIRAAREAAEEVVVSIFVNPLQFGSSDDLAHYPRDLARDVAAARDAGATTVFAPSEADVFPDGPPVVTVDPGRYGSLLEGRSRPGHMRGVLTIVTKLLHVVRPDVACFGEKDYEQLVVVRRLVADLDFGVEIMAVPTVRDADGLALSSRNARLGPEQRSRALGIPAALATGADAVRRGGVDLRALEELMADTAARRGVAVDYATARTPDLAEPSSLTGPLRLLAAGSVGAVRLIDNLAVGG